MFFGTEREILRKTAKTGYKNRAKSDLSDSAAADFS